MNYGLWLSAAGLQVNEHRQAVAANNLANAETTGFKEDLVVSRERLVESRVNGGINLSHPILDGLAGGLFVAPTYTDFTQGGITETESPLDVAIIGGGFFAVDRAGHEYYTRDGAFDLNPDGVLVTVRGEVVLDEGGGSIAVPEGAQLRITEQGAVLADGAAVGQLRMVDFSDPQHLAKVGGNLLEAGDAERKQFGGRLQPGALERSTIEPVTLLVKYIEASRAYQLNAELITLQDGLLGRVVNDVAKV
jgi:flagellar basal-body rod protein FlgG